MHPAGITANDRSYPWPKVPAIAICLDGCEPEYLEVSIKAGLMPTLQRIRATGTDRRAHSVIHPSPIPTTCRLQPVARPSFTAFAATICLIRKPGRRS